MDGIYVTKYTWDILQGKSLSNFSTINMYGDILFNTTVTYLQIFLEFLFNVTFQCHSKIVMINV